MCTYVPRCASGGQLDYLHIFLHDLWKRPIHDHATVRCCTRSSVSPARRFLSTLRHWHIDDLVADTADAENDIVMRQSTKNCMDTNCRNRHERRDIKVHETSLSRHFARHVLIKILENGRAALFQDFKMRRPQR